MVTEEELALYNAIWQHPRTLQLILFVYETDQQRPLWDAMLTVNTTNNLRTRGPKINDQKFTVLGKASAGEVLRAVMSTADHYMRTYKVE